MSALVVRVVIVTAGAVLAAVAALYHERERFFRTRQRTGQSAGNPPSASNISRQDGRVVERSQAVAIPTPSRKLKLPGKRERLRILKREASQMSSVKLGKIANKTKGYTEANLVEFVKRANIAAQSRQETTVQNVMIVKADFKRAMDEIKKGKKRNRGSKLVNRKVKIGAVVAGVIGTATIFTLIKRLKKIRKREQLEISSTNEPPVDTPSTSGSRVGQVSNEATSSGNDTSTSFANLGIGGLDKELGDIVRRVMATRKLSKDHIQRYDIKHVRGLILYGPPGTGKTLIAKKIGQLVNAKTIKIVNGPEILTKFIGEPEKNIRELFAAAEKDQNRQDSINISSWLPSDPSAVHVIIFDEIDAICKQRGASRNLSGVNDSIVTQLLTKMQGINDLNNVLVIGITNRLADLDGALLRSGRFDIKMQINLPDEAGRLQILKIHTSALRTYNKLDESVNLAELATMTMKFSGADLAGLVNAVQSRAIDRLQQENGKITMDDFLHALEHDVKASCDAKKKIKKPSKMKKFFSRLLPKSKPKAVKNAMK